MPFGVCRIWRITVRRNMTASRISTSTMIHVYTIVTLKSSPNRLTRSAQMETSSASGALAPKSTVIRLVAVRYRPTTSSIVNMVFGRFCRFVGASAAASFFAAALRPRQPPAAQMTPRASRI